MLLAAGCGKNEIQVYRVPKEKPAETAAQHDHSSGQESQPALGWKVPEGWEQVPAGEMRLASFRVAANGKTADVSIIPLPGLAGGDLGNVNRWRGQVGLPPVSEEELAKLAEKVTVAGQEGSLYDMGGENPGSGDKSRVLAAILRRPDSTWFIKMTGDDALVSGQKAAFVAFLKSMEFTSGAAAGPGSTVAGQELPANHPPIGGSAPSQELPASHPPIASSGSDSAAMTPGVDAASGRPQWEPPAGWKEVPGGQFLVAKFVLASPDNPQAAAVNVSTSAGEGGGLAGNINRWRQQLGLSAASEAEMAKMAAKVDVLGGQATVVDMTGTDARTGQKTRLVGAIVPRAGQTWFYKLMGNEQVVAAQKDAFTRFLQSVKYPQ